MNDEKATEIARDMIKEAHRKYRSRKPLDDFEKYVVRNEVEV